MLDAEHPLGAGLHVGRPLRYPVGSDPGWLGGCVVAAPALVLKPRDRWIDWDAAGREAHLDRVVGLARFLIRPGLACRNLASTVLGLCLDRAARYGVAPLPVETFVGPAHGGISLRATNRIHVGMTAGRGRRSAAGAQVPAKGIRMYPLVRDWRRHLGLAGPAVLLPPPPAWRLAPGLTGIVGRRLNSVGRRSARRRWLGRWPARGSRRRRR